MRVANEGPTVSNGGTRVRMGKGEGGRYDDECYMYMSETGDDLKRHKITGRPAGIK